jgi:hypothetical protein
MYIWEYIDESYCYPEDDGYPTGCSVEYTA